MQFSLIQPLKSPGLNLLLCSKLQRVLQMLCWHQIAELKASVTADTAGRSSGDHKVGQEGEAQDFLHFLRPQNHGNTSANDADLAEQKAKFTGQSPDVLVPQDIDDVMSAIR